MGIQYVFDFLRYGRRLSDDRIPQRLTRRLTILYALAAGFTSANLSYNQPILNVLADDFKVSLSQIGNVPALAQAGNAIGLLMILPLADYFPRRGFTLILMALTTILW
jgi:MFS family permease